MDKMQELTNTNKGEYLYSEDERSFKRKGWIPKIFLYFFIFMPIIGTIIIVIDYNDAENPLVVLGILWGICLGVIFIDQLSMASENRFFIYQNGFIAPRLPVTYILKKKSPFIKYLDITRVVVDKNFRISDKNIANIWVTNREGAIFGIQGHMFEYEAIRKFEEILREKVPDKIRVDSI